MESKTSKQVSDLSTFWKYEPSFWYQYLYSSEKGLNSEVANKILVEKGLHVKRATGIKKNIYLLLRQFKSPLVLLLIGAVVISAFLGNRSDVIIILSIVLTTGILSFIQEHNAGKVSEKLQSLISIKSKVLRDGKTEDLPSSQIIPGDVLVLNAGDMLPADCLIIESNELFANESSLTGESYPTRKEPGLMDEITELAQRKNCLWEGTNIVSGEAKALVIRTGEDTLLGSIAKSGSKEPETSFEKGINDFGFFLMKITLSLAIFILVTNLLSQKDILTSALFALALAVGMAPELLPAITTIAMSAGAKRLLKKKVIVKKLNAVQNLGEVTVLCSDKTGTITDGIVNVAGCIDTEGLESERVKELAYLNSINEAGYSNPIDEALKDIQLNLEQTYEKIGEVPFDFIRKRISIGVKSNDTQILITKGEFNKVISICSRILKRDGSTEEITAHKKRLESIYRSRGVQGYRVIGVCFKHINEDQITKELESDMIFAGFVMMNDPVKSDMIQTIQALKTLNIELKIITGDNKNISKAIASTLGIKKPVIVSGKELSTMSPEALSQWAVRTHIFCEVDPQQKERIIRSLKEKNTVAYMGDGINDVSAMRAADVGISVENAVDVSREAADFVLMEKDLMVLADGIREGRKTFANTLKYIFISTGSTFGNMCSVAAASLFLPFLPMLPKQILLTNFISDFPFLTVTTDNVDQEQIAKPGIWNMKLIRNYMFVFGMHSTLFDLLTFSMLYFLFRADESSFQTSWFIMSILTELTILFIIRTHKPFFKSKPGKYLLGFSSTAILVTLLLPYLPFSSEFGLIPLSAANFGAIISLLMAYILTADILKQWFFKTYHAAAPKWHTLSRIR